MTILSTSIKPNIAMQKDIFRFSATLFAETTDVYSSLDSQLQMIKCIFAKANNEPFSKEEIVVQLQNVYKYHITVEEIGMILLKQKKTFQTLTIDGEESYKLLDGVYSDVLKAQRNNIDSYIDKFIETFGIEESDACKDAIHKYLYELTTTNINAYKLLIEGKSITRYSDSELSVDTGSFNLKEQKYVHDFVEWNNVEKNIALTNIVFACLEYCMLVNGDKPNKLLVNSIRKREIYLDTNIIFRALGINGSIRKQTVISFLNKCKQAKLKLVISYNTKKEFLDTVDYYINQIRLYPSGNVYKGAYEQLSDYTLFSYYAEWRQEHPAMSLVYFMMHIKSSYDQLIKTYDIIDNERIPKIIYDSEQFRADRIAYSSSIRKLKDDLRDRYVSYDEGYYSFADNHDAALVRYIELKREKIEEDADLFFVSSDKLLRYWDLSRSEKDYPVVIYPSQLFLVLIKICGRSDNDFDSFVNFINVRSVHAQMPAEKANIIISGISAITEDITTQKILISAICDGDYQNIVQDYPDNDELYQNVQEICKKYLEEELKEKEEKIICLQKDASNTAKRIESLEETSLEHKKEISSLMEQVEKQATGMSERDIIIAKKDTEISQQLKLSEKQKEKVCDFAEKKTRVSLILKWYVFPITTIVLIFSYLLFVIFQFIACDAEWNIVTTLVEALGETTFGKKVDGYIAIVDSALFVVLTTIVIPNFFVKPWDKEKRNADKQKRIENYIKKNNLL